MNALAVQQQALLAALWDRGVDEAADRVRAHVVPGALSLRGLRAYRSNGRALAVRALQAAYPAVAQMLGEENFTAVAHALWLTRPPAHGDVALWGGALPDWLQAQPALMAQEPFLPDVARVEWALHAAATAADAVADMASFTLLQTHEADQITLALCPGASVLASAWPVVSLVGSHTEGGVTLDEAAHRLREGTAECALVWREGLQPRLRALAAAEAAFLLAVDEGRSLAQALAAAPGLAFDHWLAPAVQSGLVTAVVTQ